MVVSLNDEEEPLKKILTKFWWSMQVCRLFHVCLILKSFNMLISSDERCLFWVVYLRNRLLNLTTIFKTISKSSWQGCSCWCKKLSRSFIRLNALGVNFLLKIIQIKILLFMPKHHRYRILLRVFPNFVLASPLTSYPLIAHYSLLITYMIALSSSSNRVQNVLLS